VSPRRTPDVHRIASWMSEISLRLAGATDRAERERLAILDERPLPLPPHLIARCDGELAAALSLATGELIADPFRRTAEVQRLLLAHAAGARVAPGSLPARAAAARTPRRSPRRPRSACAEARR
jgi:hypothetical protein